MTDRTDNARAEGGRVGQIDCLDCGAMAVTVHHFDQCPAVWGAAGRAETAEWRCPAAGPHAAHDWRVTPEVSWRCAGSAETTTAIAEDMATRLAAAEAELDRLCAGGRFTMSIPAREGYDSDLLIQAALSDLRGLLATARTRPTRQAIHRAIAENDHEGQAADWYYDNQADSVMALLADKPTEAEAGARALEQAAEEIDWEWETVTASDGRTSIRQHGAAPSTLLRGRAARLRGGDPS